VALKAAELDIWLNRLAYCGKGYGTSIYAPNQKVGFQRVRDKKASLQAYLLPEYMEVYGNGDYGLEDTAVLVLE